MDWLNKKNGIDDSFFFIENVIAILKDARTGRIVRRIETHNIITNAGDIHYAQGAAGEVPSNDFDSLYLGDTEIPVTGKDSNFSSISFIAGSEKAVKTGYPRTNDDDPENTGAGANVVTWMFEYAAEDGDWTGISEGVIGIAGASADDPVLNHFSFLDHPGGIFSKDSNQELKVIINHKGQGV